MTTTDETKKKAPEPAAPAQPANITQLAASAKVDAPSKLPGLRQPAKGAVQAPEPLSEESIIRNLERARDEYAPETDAMKKKRERRQKWEKIINSIGDSVGSLSNLYFTTKGAPDMLKGTSTLSGKTKERYDKAKALRDANRANYLRYSMEIGREKGKQARWQSEQAAKQADRDYERELGKAKNARDERIAKLQGDLLGKKIQVAEYEAGIKKIEEDYAEEQQKADIIRKKKLAAEGVAVHRVNIHGMTRMAEFITRTLMRRPGRTPCSMAHGKRARRPPRESSTVLWVTRRPRRPRQAKDIR